MAFEIHWSNPQHQCAPDSVEQLPQTGVNPELVLSRGLDGTVISRFKEDEWDCRAYGAVSRYIFDSWWNGETRGPMDRLARTLTDEIKLIHWLSQTETTANAGRSRGSSHMTQLLMPLRAMAKIAHTVGTSLSESHNSPRFQVALSSSIANLDRGFNNYCALMALLADLAYWQHIDEIEWNVPRIVPEDDLSKIQHLLKNVEIKKETAREQTPLFPTRLFGKLITGVLEELEVLEPHLEGMEAFIKAVYKDPYLYCDTKTQYVNGITRVQRLYPNSKWPGWSKGKTRCLGRSATLELFGLRDYFKAHGIEHIKDLVSHIIQHQELCMLLIHAFTGMRASEVNVIPYEPVVHEAVKGFGDVPVIVSHLKKFVKSNYSQALVWATSSEGVYAVRIAQKLARLHWYRNRPASEPLLDNLPLWIPSIINRPNSFAHYDVPIMNAARWRNVAESLGLIIEASDIDELVAFDAFRNWDEAPEFAVGKYWPIRSHQLRRSVAVYASRSGMVSLPTLKTQFKHLSEVMTAVYAENSAFAASFLIDETGNPIDDSSIHEAFRQASRFNMSVRFHEQVIKSEERLRGPRGIEIQLNKDRGTLPTLFESRTETEKAIQQGRFAYRETTVGGCLSKEVCPHYGVDLILPCTSSCKDSVLKDVKLQEYIASLEDAMEHMSPNSRPYREAQSEIKFIKVKYLSDTEMTV